MTKVVTATKVVTICYFRLIVIRRDLKTNGRTDGRTLLFIHIEKKNWVQIPDENIRCFVDSLFNQIRLVSRTFFYASYILCK